MTTKILILGIFVIIGLVSAYVIFELPKNKINEDKSLNLTSKNTSDNQSISHIEPKEVSGFKTQECPKIECPKVECPKCPERIDDGKLIYIETYLNNTGNANLSDGRVKFYLKDSIRVESSLNNTFILNSSRHDRAKIIYEVNYSCEKCGECPPCRYETYYYECVCPEPERPVCRNDTAPQFMINFDRVVFHKDVFCDSDIVNAEVIPNRVIYFRSWTLYKEFQGFYSKVDEINGSGIVNCTPIKWNKSLRYGNYLLGFCYSLVEDGFVECIHKRFRVNKPAGPLLCPHPIIKTVKVGEIVRVEWWCWSITINYISNSPLHIIEVTINNRTQRIEIEPYSGVLNTKGVVNGTIFANETTNFSKLKLIYENPEIPDCDYTSCVGAYCLSNLTSPCAFQGTPSWIRITLNTTLGDSKIAGTYNLVLTPHQEGVETPHNWVNVSKIYYGLHSPAGPCAKLIFCYY